MKTTEKQATKSNVGKMSKKDQILNAARILFTRHGFAATSMNAIADKARVSKPTLYSYFTSKHDIFAEVMAAMTGDYEIHIADVEGKPVEEGIKELACWFLDLLLSDEAITGHQVAIADWRKFPEAAEQFYVNGPRSVRRLIASYLSDLKEQGAMQFDDPELAAELFMGMLRSGIYEYRLVGIKKADFTEEQLINEVVKVFLRAYTCGN